MSVDGRDPSGAESSEAGPEPSSAFSGAVLGGGSGASEQLLR